MLLNYKKFGRGKPLLILHGLFGLSDNWVTAGKLLSERFSVYLIDLRNHGASPHSDEWTYPAMANDILELMRAEKLDKITLMGHSLGGKAAMQFASMYPEKLEKLIVVDMSPRTYTENNFDFIEKLLAVNLSGMKSRREAARQLAGIVADHSVLQLLLKNIQWSKQDNSGVLEWKFNLKVIAENYKVIGQTFHVHAGINVPALFIRGGKSNYILDSDIEKIKGIFLQAVFSTIEGAGHWVHAEKLEKFCNSVFDFLK